MALQYFDLVHARRTHTFIINHSGGVHGERDINLISSILEHIQNDLYYPDIECKLTHLVFSINKSHAFTDGNKRTSIALGAYFLEINDLDFCVSRFIIGMENVAVDIADNRIDKDLLYEIVASIINESQFSEELKLKIFDAINTEENEVDQNNEPF
ncbi:death on curing protein [Chitinophaga sp. YR573]|uniref:type II toxin-antitoxin system death-on-curing family toxin n=1 Tax=Chitinophaga sp. YR573 TaxID=1881040 RepID=UPI0008B79080|nr:type II toxin-antitoxin system death-on-curing family toxin [Chitinophaga sp. YR573]SEW17531.1 death on curing protein [Chitinophaga sp. YR573]